MIDAMKKDYQCLQINQFLKTSRDYFHFWHKLSHLLKIYNRKFYKFQHRMNKILIIAFIFLTGFELQAQDSCLPLWPRVQFGNIFANEFNPEKLIVKFNTRSQCSKSFIELTDSKGNAKNISCQSKLIQGSESMGSYRTFVQRCSIQAIQFQEKIQYIAYGSNQTQSISIPFDVDAIETSLIHPNSTRTVKLGVLADWGEIHQKIGIYKSINQSLDSLKTNFNIDALLINGDLAYDMDSNNGTNYEEILNLLSRVGRHVPAFINTGNHQHNSLDDLNFFYNTFEQYGKDKKLATGLNLGPLFLIGFDPYETVFKNKTKINLRKTQTLSLQSLIETVEKGKKTGKIIIPSSHYPLKCSAQNKNCQNDTKILKDYFDVMFNNDIKFYIGGHYHTYERIYPYCQDGTFQISPSPYLVGSEKCIISVIEGIAGNDDKIIETYDGIQNYTAALSYGQTGVGLLEVEQKKVKYQHFSSENILTLKDEFQIVWQNKGTKLLEE